MQDFDRKDISQFHRQKPMENFHFKNDQFDLTGTHVDGALFAVKVKIGKAISTKIEKTAAKSLKQSSVPGFRNGKGVNRHLLEKRLGGAEKVYGETFASLVDNELKLQSPYRMLYTSHHMASKLDDQSWQVTCDLMVIPSMEPIDMSQFILPSLPHLDVDAVVDKATHNFSISNPILRTKTDEAGNSLPAEIGDSVEVSVRAFTNGNEVVELRESSVKLRMLEGYMRPPSLLKVLVGQKSGDMFLLEDNEFAKTIGLDQLTLEVTVNHTFTCEPQPVDDELAITAGYDNLKIWREVLTTNALQQMETAEVQYKKNTVIDKVRQVVKLSAPVSEEYVQMLANRSLAAGTIKADELETEKLRMLDVCDITFKLWNLGVLFSIPYPTSSKDKVAVTPSTVDMGVYINWIVDYLVEHSTWKTDDITRTPDNA